MEGHIFFLNKTNTLIKYPLSTSKKKRKIKAPSPFCVLSIKSITLSLFLFFGFRSSAQFGLVRTGPDHIGLVRPITRPNIKLSLSLNCSPDQGELVRILANQSGLSQFSPILDELISVRTGPNLNVLQIAYRDTFYLNQLP